MRTCSRTTPARLEAGPTEEGRRIAPIVATLLHTATGGAAAVSAYLVLAGVVSFAAGLALRSPHPGFTDTCSETERLLEGRAR